MAAPLRPKRPLGRHCRMITALPHAAVTGYPPPAVIPDGAGGVIAVWNDAAADHLYANRVRSDGALAWGPNGVAVSTAPGTQQFAAAASDSGGGVIVAWQDTRNNPPGTLTPQTDIYAQNVKWDGTLGGTVVATLVSLVSADARPDAVRLHWWASDPTASATLERAETSGAWRPLAHLAADGRGNLAYEDRVVAPGARYGYRLTLDGGAAPAPLGEVWVTVPRAPRLSLEGARPNPAGSELTVAFTLPDVGPATLELVDVAGRRVLARAVGELGPGEHVVALAPRGTGLRPGVYQLRLRSGDLALERRVVVVR